MAAKRSFKLRGIAAPILVRRPLFVRLCSVFVDNLTLSLRVALVAGAVLLIQELRVTSEDFAQPLAKIESAPLVPEVERRPTDPSNVPDTVLTDRVKQALNCTFKDYRNAHYGECVAEPSRVYPPPQAGPDDTGYVRYDLATMHAGLSDRGARQ